MTSFNNLLDARRPAVIVGMLFVSLMLIGVLGWQSYRLQISNDATADSVLREYAILAADEFGRRLTAGLGYRGYYQLISRFDDPQNAEEMLATVSTDQQLAAVAGLAGGFFVFDGNTFSTTKLGPAEEVEALLQQVFEQSASAEAPYHSAHTKNGKYQIIYKLLTVDTSPKKAFGFSVANAGVTKVARQAFESGPLLPASLADGQVSNELLFAEVTGAGGELLFESNRLYDSRLTVAKVLGNDYQGIVEGFRIRVSVNPDSAASLVIGGLPTSQLPVLVMVMVMVFVLMLTALWLFRREQAVIRLRTDFVSQVSHELRTPLTQIRMFAETLLLGRTRTEHESRRTLEIIASESRRLSHLVDNILRFSSISDTIQIDRCSQPLLPIIKEVCDTMQATNRQAQIQLEADASANADVDADALRQVMLNLLDNAVKYGPQEQQISVVLKSAGHTVSISVSDQGPGIPAAERQRVWTAFYRLQREQDTAISGTGIGLCVVRELVKAMDGHCWIEQTDIGTQVNIEFAATAYD